MIRLELSLCERHLLPEPSDKHVIDKMKCEKPPMRALLGPPLVGLGIPFSIRAHKLHKPGRRKAFGLHFSYMLLLIFCLSLSSSLLKNERSNSHSRPYPYLNIDTCGDGH